MRGLFGALVCVAALWGCTTEKTTLQPTPTLGALNVDVSAPAAAVNVIGPDGFAQAFGGSRLLSDLAPGQYTATASAAGYGEASSQMNVVAGLTSNITLSLQAIVVPVPPAETPKVGALNVNVNPASAAVVLTGPASYRLAFVGNRFVTDLEPGQYTAAAVAPGFAKSATQINVVAGSTSAISQALQANPIIADAARAVYRDGAGNLIALNASDLQAGRFVFYAWLEDHSAGINTAQLIAATPGDPGRPLLSEQIEIAPSFTQDLASAWVGFVDNSGIVRPVIGADIRWELDQWWTGRVNSMQFGTSDDNRIALGYGVFDDQADTRTNNKNLEAERFPLIASDYPLFNATGVGTPFVDGYTWVTLFSPDASATGRIVAVATINGEEIGKQILFKTFAPTPELQITKTVTPDIVNLDNPTHTVTYTVTVTNVGTGNATNVSLEDFLKSLNGGTYTLGPLPAGAVLNGDGFTYSFPLNSAFAPAPPQTAQRLGDAWNFAVLAFSTTTNTGATVISGNVGISAGSAATGYESASLVNGTIHSNDALAVAAQGGSTSTYAALLAKPCTGTLNSPLSNGTFTPGVYCFDSSAALVGPMTLDAQGDPAAEFVFRTVSTLNTAAGSSVSLVNGASPCNVYWIVGSSATLGASTFFAGNIIAQASITMGAGTVLSGRALARTGAVTLDSTAITAPASCVSALGNTKTFTFTADVTATGTYCNQIGIISYNDLVQTWTPIDLFDEACFTAVQSDVSIIKDFVASDNTTSLGRTLTVAEGVTAKLRVRVINSGTVTATAVTVADAFAAAMGTGAIGNYRLISVSLGTLADADANGISDGFNTVIGDLAPGATATLLFAIVASADGVFCDTATVTASGVIGNGSDSACLTVATPFLTLAKSDAPQSVLPGGSYISTIVVSNTGNATARGVAISDLLGLNAAANVRAIYVSSSLNGMGGVLASYTVTSSRIDIPAGAAVTFTVVSRIPLGAVAGTYCDIASVTSTNAASPAPEQACIIVPAFTGLQTQLVDLEDPISVGSEVTYYSVLYVEAGSNQGVRQNDILYGFGSVNSTTLGSAGAFRVVSTNVYMDTNPVVDPVTGSVLSDPGHSTSALLAESEDYTLVNTTPGQQRVRPTASLVLLPGTALYIVHVVSVPAGTPTNSMYTTSYVWDSIGASAAASPYRASSSEPTTVLP